MSFKSGNDPELWHAFKRGDKAAFASIYTMYVRDLLNYGYKVTSDRRLIEDSLQDLFFELWQSKENLSNVTSIRFYLFKALRYKILRNTKESGALLMDDLTIHTEDLLNSSEENNLIELEENSVQMIHLKTIIKKLPQRQQEALNLRYYHNFSNEEIAQIMGVNYQSACKFIYTALKNLKLNIKISALFLLLLLFSNFL